MEILIKKDTMADGKPVRKGQTVDVSDAEADLLVSEKKAKLITSGASDLESDKEDSEEAEPVSTKNGKK